MSKDGLVKGAFILMIAIMTSKLLGFLYVIPFTALVGVEGFVLFEYAYKPYAVILQLATLGIPLAVSKYVSKYNELGDYKTGLRLLKTGVVLLGLMGIVGGTALFVLAPHIANIVIDPTDQTGNSIEDVVFVIRMLSISLFVVPPMGIIRGFFQGNHFMNPTGHSQIIEQMVRVTIIIGGSYFIVKVLDKSETFAVGIATLGTSIGAIFAFCVLGYYIKKRKDLFVRAKEQHLDHTPRIRHIYKEIVRYAIPFAMVSLAIPIYQLVDTFSINQALMSKGINQGDAEVVNSIVGLVQRVVFIPVALATAFAYTLVPHITSSHITKNYEMLHSQITKTFHTIWLVTLPAVVGLFVVGKPAYTAMFGAEYASIGGELLMWYAPTGILFALFIITTSMMEGMDQYKQAVYSMLVGVAVKIIFNYPMVQAFEGMGSIITTNIGFAISILINLLYIKKEAKFHMRNLAKELLPITTVVVAMGIVVFFSDYLIKDAIYSVVKGEYLRELFRLAVGVLVGVLVYGILILNNTTFQTMFGSRLPKVLRRG